MPEQTAGTQAGAGTAGTGATPPATAPQGSSTGAAPPGPQAGHPGAAGGGAAAAGSPAGAPVDQARRELDVRMSAQGREIAELKRQLAERAGTARPPEGAPEAPPQITVAAPAPVVDPQTRQRWEDWANGQFTELMNGHVWQEPDENGQPVLKRIPPDLRAARDFARVQDRAIRDMGITPAWDGMFGIGSRQNAPQPSADAAPMTREQLDAWFDQKRQQAAISDLDVDEQFDESLKAVCETRKIGPDFFTVRMDMGNGRQQARERVIGRYLASEGLPPTPENVERAILAKFPGDLWAYQQQQAYAAATNQARQDQQGLAPGMARNIPFPETPPDEQAVSAYEVGGRTHFGGKPQGAARVVAVTGAPRM